MQASVSEDRQNYLGGSDIPIIMGISPFKTYYQLLKEKAGLEEIVQVENEYIDYGNLMEPKIRDYINKTRSTNFVENKKTIDHIRCHTDGFNGEEILEIKTTSKTHKKLSTYKNYLVQLLFYMMNYNLKKGLLAIYKRPKDFNEELDFERLTIYEVDINDFQDLCIEINQAVDKYFIDKKRLEENVLLGEEDFN